MCSCIYACMNACMHMYLHAWECIHGWTCIHEYMCTCIYVSMLERPWMCAYKHACMHSCMHACMHACVPMQTCMYAFMRHAYVHSCKHASMHIFGICAVMQTFLHTCLYLQVCMRTCVHLYMQSYLHTCMIREVWCLVWWERERERAWCKEIIMSLKSFFRHSHPTVSLTQDHITLPLSHCRPFLLQIEFPLYWWKADSFSLCPTLCLVTSDILW